MFDFDKVGIVYDSTLEVLDYYFKNPEEAKKLIKFEEKVCPASCALYILLKDSTNNEFFLELEKSNFCKKAKTILPVILDISMQEVVYRLDPLMLNARNAIDKLGKTSYRQKNIVSTSREYVKFPREEAIKMLEEENGDLTEQDVIEKIRLSHTNSNYAKNLHEIIERASDAELDSPYMTKAKEAVYDYGKIEDEEREAIAKMIRNRIALAELKNIGDYHAYQYKGVFMTPSIVSIDRTNPELFTSDDIIIRKNFEVIATEIELKYL